ncbi:MAG: putative alpha/beta hydrolase [Arcticibacterium sp.]|jgi:predicted alpha/beta hydrolase
MNSVLKFLKQKFQNIPFYFLCHSVGGQMIGLIPNINDIEGVLAISTSSGYAKNMKLWARLQSFYFFRIVRPIIHLIYGYSKFKFLGIMEDMPIKITNCWYEWCSRPEYFFDPKNAKKMADLSGFKNLKIPIEVAIATDDPICPKLNVENLWKNFHSSGGINFNWLKPEDFDLKTIGHFHFFRKTSKAQLWPWALDKLEHLS